MDTLKKFMQDEQVLVGIATVSAALLVKYLSKTKPRRPPGPRVWPVIGTIPSMKNDIRVFNELAAEYGDIYYVQNGLFGYGGAVVLNNIDLIREAFLQKQDDFAGRSHFATIDILSMNGSDIIFGDFTPVWRYQRKISHAAIRKYGSGKHFQEIVENCVDIVSDIFIKSEGKPLDIRDPIMLLFYNIIASMCFGKKYEMDDPEFVKIYSMLEEFKMNFTSGALGDLLPALKDVPTKFQKTMRKNCKIFFDFIGSILKDHRENFDKGDVKDLAYYLIQLDEEMRDKPEEQPVKLEEKHFLQVFSDMFLAGNDTVRYTMLWTLYLLAANPDKQKKAQQEIDKKIGKNGIINTITRVEIPYCEAILYEVLRLRSPAPTGVPHETTCDTSVGGYDIPKGTQIIPNLQWLHMNPKEWDNSEEFRPERFIDEHGNLAPKPNSFLPFSTGRRQCVGEALAKSELHVILGMLLQRFTFEAPPGVKINLDLMPSLFSVLAHRNDLIIRQR